VLHRRDKAWVRTYEAFAHGDWARLLANADEAVKLYPTYYHFYWLKGAALYNLGRKAEAVEPLQIYTKYSRDELDYQQAADWLKEIQLAKRE
jgi:hypothetical protein